MATNMELYQPISHRRNILSNEWQFCKQFCTACNVYIMAAFSWSDDLSKVLLEVAIEYKTEKAAEVVDWESMVSK